MRKALLAIWAPLCMYLLSHTGCAEGTPADQPNPYGEGGDSAAGDAAQPTPDVSADAPDVGTDLSIDSRDSMTGGGGGADAALPDADGAIGDSGGGGGAAGDASADAGDGSSGSAGVGGAGGKGGSAGAAGTGGSAGSGGVGGTGGAAGSAGMGGGAPYSHKIEIDGKNDFSADDAFATSSSTSGYSGYVSWDADNLYLGLSGDDVASAVPNKWILIYLDGTSGSATGQKYNTQTPSLPFSAHWHMRWRADNGLTSMQAYTTGWGEVSPAWDFEGDVFQKDKYVEFQIPRADIGNPAKVAVVMCMINEKYPEWTYASVPSTSIDDGYNPIFTKYFEFDFSSSRRPKDYVPKP